MDQLPDELWDAERLAAYLNVGKAFVYRLTRERRIRFVRVGKELRFIRADVTAYLAAEAIPVEPRRPARTHRPVARHVRRRSVAALPHRGASDVVEVRAPW